MHEHQADMFMDSQKNAEAFRSQLTSLLTASSKFSNAVIQPLRQVGVERGWTTSQERSLTSVLLEVRWQAATLLKIVFVDDGTMILIVPMGPSWEYRKGQGAACHGHVASILETPALVSAQ